MPMSDDKSPEGNIGISSKMDVLDDSLAVLILIQNALDRAGFSMSSIHVNSAIETMRADRIRLREQFKV